MMTPDQRRALAQLRFEYAPVPEDIWRPLPYHVDGLQPEAEQAVLAALEDAERSRGASPLGLILSGQRGAGKTHLLGLLRQQVHTRHGYFFLVGLLDASSFWRSVLVSMVEGLMRPWGGERTQAQVLMLLLADRIGAPDELLRVLTGLQPATPEALDEFSLRLRQHDRALARQAGATARAMALFVADDPEQEEIAETYLQGDEDDLGLRVEWGLPSAPRSPEEIVRDLTALMALSGPVVIAVDQIDTLIAQSTRSLASGRGGADRRHLLLEQIAGGLMALRERTRRTLTVVACLPSTWSLIKDQATDTVQDRFRETSQLRSIPDADLGRQLIETRFAHHLEPVGFQPPYPTWPVAPAAFADAPGYTPRELLKVIDRHLRACERADEVTELTSLDSVVDEDGTEEPPPEVPAPTVDEADGLDQLFARARAEVDPTAVTAAGAEDDEVPRLLAAGLSAWVLERIADRERFSVDPPPGRKPALHARLRLTLDDETEDQLHWSYRAIGSQHGNAELSRLRKACTAAAVATEGDGRNLTILRSRPWGSGPRTVEAVAAFVEAGGRTVAPDEGEIRTLGALARLLDSSPPHLSAWLRSRRPASGLSLFADLPSGDDPTGTGAPAIAPTVTGPDTTTEPLAEQDPTPGGEPEPDGAATVAEPPDPTPTTPPPPERPAPPVDRSGVDAATTLPLGYRLGDDAPVAVPLETLRKHVAIFAGSGSGKTVLIRRLIEEAALRGVSSIVLDPNNDLARLGDPWPERPSGWRPGDEARAERYLDGTEVVVWTPRRSSGRPLSFQPLPDFRSVLDDVDEFDEAVGVAVASLEPRLKLSGRAARVELGRAVLRSAVGHFGRSGGGSLEALARLLRNLPYGVSGLADAKKIANGLSQLLTAAMVNDPLFGGEGTPVDPGTLLTPSDGHRARVSVISLVGLPSDLDRQGFVNQLQMALFAWIKRNPAADRPLGGLFIMDEAQTFAPSGAATACTQSTLALASQARKYGLGLVFATQAPKGLHNRIPGNATTQFFGRLNAPTQVAAAREMATAKGGAVSDISRLGAGEFYASLETGQFDKIQAPLCLSHHPASPLTTEEVIERASS